ncbi:HAMP domain-containing histidine kinase [Porphyromonadaceae bacterium OttesenSCG-928-L07]|nr:HAMP domain-containing histidine kinase [Porphyromonadaceae bacterium OttesenSCG-928-L07]MDL2252304.1 HAMP domain-containing histidine kinase [Odoribacter sp. OttesenSCG-928-J03]MDL2331172.1 HAMP domain-containing histidine kinase [Odoribacter sp. OttesenSCG-928-A06]
MIKKIFIRTLLILMVAAFLGVVLVQWLWIRNALKEREGQFASQVYDVLYRIDQINYMEYTREVRRQSGKMPDYRGLITPYSLSLQQDFLNSSYLKEYISGDIPDLRRDRSFLSMQSPSISTEKKEEVKEQEHDYLLRIVRESDSQNSMLKQRLGKIDVRGLLVRFLFEQKINLDFQHEFLKRDEVIKKAANNQRRFYYIPLFPVDNQDDYYLGVTFKTITPVVFENMAWPFLASAFCILGLLTVFIITIFTIMRQQKLSVIKNDFINNMTHEFKTPIATISLATSAIEKDKVLANREQILSFNNIIKEENKRMNEYVERMLQQAKMAKNEVYLNKTEVDMNELVKKAAGHFMLQANDRGGRLEVSIEVPEFTYHADCVHMLNVFCNLLDNAIKYSPDKPDVLIYVKKEEDAYVIGVQDKGIGISRDAQKKIFERFYRVPSGNIHQVKGFGLGLSYVKSIVELHGGVVRLRSGRYRGTLVEIILK